MKKLEITIKLKIKGDPEDTDTVREDVYEYLQELMEEGELAYEINYDEDEDEDEDADY